MRACGGTGDGGREDEGVGWRPYTGALERSTTPHNAIKVRHHLHPTVELIILFYPAFVLYSSPQSVIIHPHSTLIGSPTCACVV